MRYVVRRDKDQIMMAKSKDIDKLKIHGCLKEIHIEDATFVNLRY